MDAPSLPPSELDEFFDAVETQSNHPPSLFNSPTAIRTRAITFSSPLPLQNENQPRLLRVCKLVPKYLALP